MRVGEFLRQEMVKCIITLCHFIHETSDVTSKFPSYHSTDALIPSEIQANTHTHTARHITMMHWIFTLLWICVLVAPAARHSFIFILWYFYRFSTPSIFPPLLLSLQTVWMNKYRKLDLKSFHSTLVHVPLNVSKAAVRIVAVKIKILLSLSATATAAGWCKSLATCNFYVMNGRQGFEAKKHQQEYKNFQLRKAFWVRKQT